MSVHTAPRFHSFVYIYMYIHVVPCGQPCTRSLLSHHVRYQVTLIIIRDNEKFLDFFELLIYGCKVMASGGPYCYVFHDLKIYFPGGGGSLVSQGRRHVIHYINIYLTSSYQGDVGTCGVSYKDPRFIDHIVRVIT